jgi:cytidylate kinase
MPADSTVAKLVEKQMRNWELARRQVRRVERRPEEKQVEDFITISREVGAGGAAVAQRLGDQLGWPVFDKEILRHMAKDDQVRTRLYEKMDERDANWLESVLRWLLEGEFRKEDYFHRLSETVLALARQGPGIFLGRAADRVLPQDRGLRVRLVAPEEQRVAEFAQRNQCDEDAARDRISDLERERTEFTRRHFDQADDAPLRFDVVLNRGRFSVDETVEVISAALRLRQGRATSTGDGAGRLPAS